MQKNEIRLNFDLDDLKNVSISGVRRAAAFSAIALNATQNPLVQSLSLPSYSMWRFLPENPPEELLISSVKEFRVWVVGNALRELDAAFNELLDNCWQMNEWSKLHGQKVKSDHRVESIEAKTNVGTKMGLVLKELGEKEPDTTKLWTLSNLRNCLTHARGVVTSRHANDATGLKVLWLGLELGFQQEGNYVPMPMPIPQGGVQAPNPAEPANVVAKVVDREKIFPFGSSVSIEPRELHEICHFYLTSTNKVVQSLQKAMSGRGLLIVQKDRPEETRA